MRSRVVSMLVSVRLGSVDLQHRREIFLAHFGRLHLELLLQLPQRATLADEVSALPLSRSQPAAMVNRS